ncbi:MAG: T9SS type A sorting domain-containing protein [Sporocytophaga sp.]|uniref:Ig-like domain-containing protein n=1 Tax=Sporocytophaga sp. TaxID=2231183 RepID=UPI001B051522|nr:Ig-like domain-containing protein [Sporocytophaga sp.]MBO9699870.1 T9SS type A sorting domain-containing protein [Sporocytophaga sp.]
MLKAIPKLLPESNPTALAKKFLLSLSIFSAFSLANAQNKENEGTFVGSVSEFQQQLKSANKKRKNSPTLLPLSNGKKLTVDIHYDKISGTSNTIAGKIKDNAKSTFNLTFEENNLKGEVLILNEKKAYEYYTKNENVYAKEVDINKVVCIETPVPAEGGPQTSSSFVAPFGSYVYNLQSLPSSEYVVYLDFDGQYVVDPYWNGGLPIDALPSELNETEIEQAWRLISEDYRPFNLNITTDSAVFLATPINKRVRVIFTPTNDAAPGYGGYARIGSFPMNVDTPCWVFLATSKYAGEAGSHEIGHTLGLYHDGVNNPYEEYYGGQGNWAPIMGVGYSKDLVQFSKGEYNNANNSYQDDINIITSYNGFSFKTDESGNIPSLAKQLVYSSSGFVSSSDNNGVIEKRDDVDYFYFNTLGGSVKIAANPDPYYPNLDISLTLKNSAGNTIAVSDLEGLSAYIDTLVPAGTYFLIVDGVGHGDPAIDGYSDFGSLGYYSLVGSISNSVNNKIPTISITSPSEGADILIGTPITISAIASDPDGTVTRVDFYDGATLLGSDINAPYSFVYSNAPGGTRIYKAIAFDNQGGQNYYEITVLVAPPNQLPTVSVTSPINGAILDPAISTVVTANAYDNDGTITAVYFYKDNTIVGVDYTAPYSVYIDTYIAGIYNIRAEAVDNRNGRTFSAVNSFTVKSYGLSGPSCAIKGIPYNFRVYAEYSNPVNITAYTNSDATISFDYYDRRYFDVTFNQYAASSVTVTALLSYTAYPYNVEYTKVISTNGCGTRASVMAIPLPDASQTAVSLDTKETISSFKVIDMTGREVASGEGQNVTEVIVGENLKNGIYIVNIIAESGSYIHKIVK